jgi:hypothetical protein
LDDGEEMLYLPLKKISSELGPTIADPSKLMPTKGKLLSKSREIIKIPRPPSPRKR